MAVRAAGLFNLSRDVCINLLGKQEDASSRFIWIDHNGVRVAVDLMEEEADYRDFVRTQEEMDQQWVRLRGALSSFVGVLRGDIIVDTNPPVVFRQTMVELRFRINDISYDLTGGIIRFECVAQRPKALRSSDRYLPVK